MIFECPKCEAMISVDDDEPLHIIKRKYSRCPKCGWYLRLAGKHAFRCSSCGRTRYLKSIPTSDICPSCAAKKRADQNVPVSMTEKLVVTTNVEKRLRKKAEVDIPKNQAEIKGEWLSRWIFVFFWASGYFVARTISNAAYPNEEFTGLFWLVILVWCFVLPFIGMEITERTLSPMRQERARQIENRKIELAEERKRRQEEEQLFYSSPEWAKLRDLVIKEEGRVCAECHRHIKKDSDVTVDHIRPRSKYPDLALRRDNLRVLCRSCNSKKSDIELANPSSF